MVTDAGKVIPLFLRKTLRCCVQFLECWVPSKLYQAPKGLNQFGRLQRGGGLKERGLFRNFAQMEGAITDRGLKGAFTVCNVFLLKYFLSDNLGLGYVILLSCMNVNFQAYWYTGFPYLPFSPQCHILSQLIWLWSFILSVFTSVPCRSQKTSSCGTF